VYGKLKMNEKGCSRSNHMERLNQINRWPYRYAHYFQYRLDASLTRLIRVIFQPLFSNSPKSESETVDRSVHWCTWMDHT